VDGEEGRAFREKAEGQPIHADVEVKEIEIGGALEDAGDGGVGEGLVDAGVGGGHVIEDALLAYGDEPGGSAGGMGVQSGGMRPMRSLRVTGGLLARIV
jgi:hypothetical protein